jgi:hypothetical protein
MNDDASRVTAFVRVMTRIAKGEQLSLSDVARDLFAWPKKRADLAIDKAVRLGLISQSDSEARTGIRS